MANHKIEVTLTGNNSGLISSINAAIASIQSLNAAGGNAGNGLGNLNSRIDVTANMSAQMAAIMSRLSATIMGLSMALNGASSSSANNTASMNAMAAAALRLEAAMNAAASGSNNAGNAGNNHRNSMDGSILSMIKMSAIGTLVYGSINMVTTAFKDGIVGMTQYQSKMEQNMIAFETFFKSSAGAKVFFQDLQKMAADTPFELPQLTAAAKKMMAFGFAARDIIPMMTGIGNAVSGLGGGPVLIDRITIALGQMKAKGRVQGDELLQMAEAGIPAYQILQEKLGLTSKQVANIGREGINADKAIKALVEGMNERFPDMMKKQSDSAQGMFSTIKDNVMIVGASITDGLFNKLKDSLEVVRDFSNKLQTAASSGKTSDILKSLIPEDYRERFNTLYNAFQTFISSTSALFSNLWTISKPIVVGLGDLFLAAMPSVLNFGTKVANLGNSIMPALRVACNLVAGVLKLITDNARIAVEALAAFIILTRITGLALALWDAFIKVRAVLAGIAIMTTFTTMVTGIVSAVRAVTTLRSALLLLGAALKTVTRGNIVTVLLAIGLAVMGDKLFEMIDKFKGSMGLSDSDSGSKAEEERLKAEAAQAKADADNARIQEEGRAAVNAHNGSPTITDESPAAGAYAKAEKAAEAAIAKLKTDMELAIRGFEEEKKTIEARAAANNLPLSPAEQGKIDALNVQVAQARISAAANSVEILEKYLRPLDEGDKHSGNTDSKIEAKKQDLLKYSDELRLTVGRIENLGKVIDAMGNSIKAVNGAAATFTKTMEDGEGKTWSRSEADNPNTKDVLPNTRAALNDIANAFFEKTGKQLLVTSGFRTWGAGAEGAGHKGGFKFDAAGGELESGGAELRAWLKAYAKSVGVVVLNNYAEAREEGSGPEHFDFDAKNYTPAKGAVNSGGIANLQDFADRALKSATQIDDKIVAAAKDVQQALIDAQTIKLELKANTGDTLDKAISDIETKYYPLFKKFTKLGWKENADDVLKLMGIEKAKATIAQTSKKWETAKTGYDLDSATLKSNFPTVAQNIPETNALQAEYTKRLQELANQAMAAAKESGDPADLQKAEQMMLDVKKQAADFANGQFEKVRQELQAKIDEINARPDLADVQKEEMVKGVKKDYAPIINSTANAAVDALGKVGDTQQISQVKAYQEQLGKVPTYLDDISNAANKALAGGLQEFFETGIFKCKSLGEAFANLALSVLQSIQKINAQKITANLMESWGMNQPAAKKPGAATGGYITGGTVQHFASGGHIKGEGTGTSDSILARLSNGEFVTKASTVRRVGVRFMHALNQGLVSPSDLPKFATGGLIGAPSSNEIKPMNMLSNASTDPSLGVKIINVTDPNQVGRYLATRHGEKAFLNMIDKHSEVIKRIVKR